MTINRKRDNMATIDYSTKAPPKKRPPAKKKPAPAAKPSTPTQKHQEDVNALMQVLSEWMDEHELRKVEDKLHKKSVGVVPEKPPAVYENFSIYLTTDMEWSGLEEDEDTFIGFKNDEALLTDLEQKLGKHISEFFKTYKPKQGTIKVTRVDVEVDDYARQNNFF